jgi:hypothetical protein
VQSLSDAQDVLHEVAFAQMKLPGQAAGTPGVHEPVAQLLAGVRVEPLQLTPVVHALLQQTFDTQLLLMHWAPLVQAVPFERAAHVPAVQRPETQSAFRPQCLPFAHFRLWPSHCAPPQSTSVSLPSMTESVHDTHRLGLVPKHKLFTQSLLEPHLLRSAHLWLAPSHVAPPQSTSVSVPFCTVSVQVGGWQSSGFPLQTPLMQSPATRQCCCGPVSWQVGPHEPPQSMSVSSASCTPSVQ